MRFQPGQSGNPAGRPPGSLNKKTLALQEAFEAKAEEIVDDVIARAKTGQPTAMRWSWNGSSRSAATVGLLSICP
jgi:hypothetical protein